MIGSPPNTKEKVRIIIHTTQSVFGGDVSAEGGTEGVVFPEDEIALYIPQDGERVCP